MKKLLLPLACAVTLSACGMMGSGPEQNQEGEITTGGGATNEVLEPIDRTPADWPTDTRPYQKSEPGQSSGSSGSSGSSSMSGQSSGASDSAPEVIILTPAEGASSSSGSDSMESGSGSSSSESVTSGTSGASGSDMREDVERTPGEWPTDKRPYVEGQK